MNNSLTEPPFIPSWAKNYTETIFFIYNGKSMAPLFVPGDLLCVRKSVFGSAHLGDVVICDWGTDKNYKNYVVHRVVSVKNDYLVTQGDNNLKPDQQALTEHIFVGLVTSFNRGEKVYPVRSGYIGFIYARFILARNYIWLCIKRLGWRIYALLRQSGLAARLWHPAISQLKIKTDNGLLIKYCCGNRTVARWRLDTKKFDVVKPFDLVIPHPEESK